MRCKLRVLVRYDLGGKPKPGVHVLVVHLGDLGPGDRRPTGQEDGTSRAPVIHYCQYAVKASTLGEACDKVHGDLCEWGCIFGDGDFVKWGAGFVLEVLILLAHGAPLYVLLHPGSCLRLEIVMVDLPDRLVSPSMPPSLVFVPYPQDFSLYLIVWGHHQSIAQDVLPHDSV